MVNNKIRQQKTTLQVNVSKEEDVAKLRAELANLEASQERMKEVNKVIRQRSGDEEEQVNGLLALGWLTNTQARDLVPRTWQKVWRITFGKPTS